MHNKLKFLVRLPSDAPKVVHECELQSGAYYVVHDQENKERALTHNDSKISLHPLDRYNGGMTG